MSDWNPSLYLHFSAERSRPAVELLARVPLENVEYVADLGCGPGNSTALLHQRWPAARITGIDSSPAMIAEARSALPDCQFVEADIRNWQPEQALDLIFANASLQWLPDHYESKKNGDGDTENAERCEGEFDAQMRVPGQHEYNSNRKEKIE